MVGLGETEAELFETIRELRENGCDVLTIGQYLQPTSNHLKVQRFVHPDQFKSYRVYAQSLGFKYVESGPLVRSSYHAEQHVF